MKINYLKWLVIIGLAAALFFWGRSCGIKSVIKKSNIDTTVHSDNSSIIYVPVPYKVEVPVPYKVKTSVPYPVYVDTGNHQPDVYLPPAAKDTCTINETVYYSDSLKPPKINRGSIIIKDTLKNNRIIGRSISVKNTDTIITKTTVLMQPKKTIVYLGLSVTGNKYDLLYGIGSDLSIKFKNDVIYSVGAKYLTVGGWMGEVGVKIPIRLK